MKKRILAFLFAASLCLAASAPAPTDNRTVLSTATVNGVTTTLYVGRVQTDPAKDGTATLTVFPDKVITDSSGNVLASGFANSFSVPLSAQQYAAIAGIIQQAYGAQQSATPSPSP